jgi:hypothetical protein
VGVGGTLRADDLIVVAPGTVACWGWSGGLPWAFGDWDVGWLGSTAVLAVLGLDLPSIWLLRLLAGSVLAVLLDGVRNINKTGGAERGDRSSVGDVAWSSLRHVWVGTVLGGGNGSAEDDSRDRVLEGNHFDYLLVNVEKRVVFPVGYFARLD